MSPEKPVPIVPDDLTRRVLDGCKGRSLVSRRDVAIVRLLFDTGCRLSEIASLTLDDVDLTLDVVHVLGKGWRSRIVPFGARTRQALSRYLRVRDGDRWRQSSALWLADRSRGPLQANGIKLMLRRRGPSCGRSSARAPVPAHAREYVASGRWRRHRLDAHHGVANSGNASSIRRECSRRTRSSASSPTSAGGSALNTRTWRVGTRNRPVARARA